MLGDSFTYVVSDVLGQSSNEATVVVSNLPGGLVAHYEADAFVEQEAGVVVSWGDQSSGGNDLGGLGDVQLLPDALNGHPVLDFDGDGDVLMRAEAITGLPLGSANRSVYLVANYEGLGSGGFAYGQQSSNRAFGLHVEGEGLLRVNGFGGAYDFVSTTMGTGAGWLVQSAVLLDNEMVHAINGVTIDNYLHTYNTGLGPMVLGADLDQSPAVDMQVAALLVFDRALSEAEQAEVQTFLQSKYNVRGVGAPQVADDAGVLVTGGTVEIDVLSNDTPVEGEIDASSVTVVRVPGSGTVSVNTATGVITYEHDGTAGTSDTFTYTVANDAGRVSSEATVLIEGR